MEVYRTLSVFNCLLNLARKWSFGRFLKAFGLELLHLKFHLSFSFFINNKNYEKLSSGKFGSSTAQDGTTNRYAFVLQSGCLKNQSF